MNYISTGEAAKKWGVRPRNVQRYLAQERVPGAKKYGNYWMIPDDAEKPKDPRLTRSQEKRRPFYTLPRQCPILMMTNMYSVPGTADAALNSLKYDETAYIIGSAGLEILRGNHAGALELIERLPFDETKPDVYIAIAFIRSYAPYTKQTYNLGSYTEKN